MHLEQKLNLNHLLDELAIADILHPLNRIQLLEQQAHRNNIAKVLLLPIPLWIYWRVFSLLQKHPHLQSFRKGIVLSLPLAGFSTLLYVLMWWHLVPIVYRFLPVLQSPSNAEAFFQSLWHEHTFRTVWAVAAHLLVALWALKDFHLTPTFSEQVTALQQTIAKKWEDTMVQVQAQQQLATLQPELLKNFANQVGTILLANGDLSPQERQKLIATLSEVLQGVPLTINTPAEQPLPQSYGKDPFS